MQKLTRSNVAHDLNISPHNYTIIYGNDSITFVFSSDLYKRKFIDKLHDHRITINQSLFNRFGFLIKFDVLSDLRLYTMIEKRGFLLYLNEDKILCPKELLLTGVIKTNKQ